MKRTDPNFKAAQLAAATTDEFLDELFAQLTDDFFTESSDKVPDLGALERLATSHSEEVAR